MFSCQVCYAHKAKFMRKRVEILPEIRYNNRMLKIWAKVMNEGRIVAQTTYEQEETFSYAEFFRYLTDICLALDIPTPVLLKPHLFQYAKFRHVVFRKSDFMEDVPFDKLLLENIL